MNAAEAITYINELSQAENPSVTDKKALMDCPHCRNPFDMNTEPQAKGLYTCPHCKRSVNAQNQDVDKNKYPEKLARPAFRNPEDAANILCDWPGNVVFDVLFANAEQPKSANHAAASVAVLRGMALTGFGQWLDDITHKALDGLQAELVRLVKTIDPGQHLFNEADRIIGSTFTSLTHQITEHLQQAVHPIEAIGRRMFEHHGVTPGTAHVNVADLWIAGNNLRDTLDKLADDTSFKFKALVRLSQGAKEDTAALVKRLVGEPEAGNEWLMGNTGLSVAVRFVDSAMTALDKTVGMAVQALAQEVDEGLMDALGDGDDEAALGWTWIAVLDEKVCDRCSALDGSKWDQDFEPVGDSEEFEEEPPLHPNCRCVLAAVDLDSENVPRGTHLDSFLGRSSKASLDAVYGRAASDAYHEGRLSGRELMGSVKKLSPQDLADIAKGMGDE
jgi:hypothetical protein